MRKMLLSFNKFIVTVYDCFGLYLDCSGWKVLVDEWVSATSAIAGILYVCLVSGITLPYMISYR